VSKISGRPMSNTCTEEFNDPAASVRPDGWNATHGLPPSNVATSQRSARFHNDTAPSEPPVASQSMPPPARNLPSGENATDSTVQPSSASGMTRTGSP